MNPGDIVLYDRFGSRQATVAPSMRQEDQGIGIIVSSINKDFGCDIDEEPETSWVKILTDTGKIKEISLCYLVETDDFYFSHVRKTKGN
jgi:hypothetical protein